MRLPEPKVLVVAMTLLAGSARAEPVLRPAPLPDGEYVENFTFVADLDDGTYVQLQMGVTNLGPGSSKAFCRALVGRAGGAPWTASDRFGNHWGHRVDGGTERLDVGTCWATSGPEGSRARAALGGRALEIQYPQPAVPRDPPAAEVQVGTRSYRSWILQVFTQVTVRREGFGVDGVVAGGGYADHSRSNVRPKELARSWVRFRALRGQKPLLLLGREATDGTWGPAWLWRAGGAAQQVPHLTVQRDPPRSAPAFSITLDGGAVAGRIATVAPVYRYASLSELGFLAAVVAPWLGNPVTYTQRAILSPAGEGPIEGILEVSVSDE